MRLTKETWEVLDWLRQWPLPDHTPADVWVGMGGERSVRLQAPTQANVKAIRRAFPAGLLWRKEFNTYCAWWQYTTTLDGIELRIFACAEAPPACRAIVETYEAEERVPVAFETRTVTKERVRWECPEPVPAT